MRLELEAQSDMAWVVVEDPVPGGATILGSGLGGQSPLLTREERREGYAWPAFEERRFDSFRAYYRYVPKGRWVVEYTVRLNNPGTFLLPATRVEAMYAPEMFGESPNAPVAVEREALNRRAYKWLGGVAALAAVAVIALAWPAQAPQFAAVRAGFTPSDAFLLDRNGTVLDTTRIDMKVRRFEWQPLPAISPALAAAVVRGEDARFWEHDGIDWRSVVGAARDRFLRGRNRGASTITMQVASLLQARPHAREGVRAWRQKRDQARLARAIEKRWTKQQILEAYLNLAYFRGELQGIGAAAHLLAGKVPSGLSLQESLVLAALAAGAERQSGPGRSTCLQPRAHSRAWRRLVMSSNATATLLLTHGVRFAAGPATRAATGEQSC